MPHSVDGEWPTIIIIIIIIKRNGKKYFKKAQNAVLLETMIFLVLLMQIYLKIIERSGKLVSLLNQLVTERRPPLLFGGHPRSPAGDVDHY